MRDIYSTPIKQRKMNSKKSNSSSRSDDSEDNVPLSTFKTKSNKTPFHEFLPTPDYGVVKNKRLRKKAINYKGQRITKDLFTDNKNNSQKKMKKPLMIKSNKAREKDVLVRDKKALKYTKKKNTKEPERKQIKKMNNKENDETEDWYCHACHENQKLDMRQCNDCKKWYHEDCVGLTKDDSEFICSSC